MYCATAAHPSDDGATLDFDYFLQSYVAVFVEAPGGNCVRYEVRKGLEQPGGPPPPYICVANFYVSSGEQVGATLARHGNRLYGDIPKFTNTRPVRAWEEVINSSNPPGA